jgi:uncharacterized cupin superfamily protein
LEPLRQLRFVLIQINTSDWRIIQVPATVSSATSSEYEPLIFEGKNIGERYELAAPPEVAQPELGIALWRSGPVVVEDYLFTRDEAVYIVAGAVTVEVEGEAPVTLREGDVAFFAGGKKAVWRVDEFIHKFSVIAADR